MDGCRFDALSKFLARSSSRRDALRALGGFLGIAALGSAKVAPAAAQIACPPPLTSCSGACVNTTNNPRNCGTCGTVCPTGQFCAAGQCQCPPGLTLCGNTCLNTQTDARNCGTCNNVCPQGQICKSGACQLPAGVTAICNGAPANTQSDPTNCGACGVRCTPGLQLSGQCCGGVCCPTGTVCLNGACSTACNGKIVNLQNDPNNCGACAHQCANGQRCINGTCITAGCLADSDCSTNSYCNTTSNTCLAGCRTSPDNCGRGLTCNAGTHLCRCNATCTDSPTTHLTCVAGGIASDDQCVQVACVISDDCPPSAPVCQGNTCVNLCLVNNVLCIALDQCHAAGACDPATGLCTNPPATIGTFCNASGGTICNGSGLCVVAHCADKVKNADETDQDCGGSACPPCAQGKACLVNSDCQSGVCVCPIGGCAIGTEGICQ